MDNKPLLQDRPPAYNAVPGAYEYGAIPAAAPPAAGFQPPAPPPPYQGFPVSAAGYPAAPGQLAAGYPAAQGQLAAGYPAAPGQFAAGYPAAQGQLAAGYPAAQGQTAYTSTYTIVQPSVVVVGGCPACRVGVLEDDFTCLGIMCAIFFFPLGILFCLALRQRRCPNCGATFG